MPGDSFPSGEAENIPGLRLPVLSALATEVGVGAFEVIIRSTNLGAGRSAAIFVPSYDAVGVSNNVDVIV